MRGADWVNIVVDTNVLIDYTDKVFNKFLMNNHLIIPACVLKELDKLKINDSEVGYKARLSVKKLIQNKSLLTFCMNEDYHEKMPAQWQDGMNDNRILSCALHNDASLLSNDALLNVKAESLGLHVIKIDDGEEGIYTGIREINASESQEFLSLHYLNPNNNVFNLYPNEYLIVYDYEKKNNKILKVKRDRIRCWTGEKFRELELPMADIVEPLNDSQACAIDLLFNMDVPVKIITGTYGSGKTLLAMKAAIYQVMGKGYYDSIYCVRNPVGADETDGITSKGIGYLPGSKEEKIKDFFKPVTQYLGNEEYTNKLLADGTLKYDIPYFMKGVSIDRSFIMVDEAEDMNLRLLKLIGTRVGEHSAICFSGDIKQAENAYIKNNGLMALINATKNNKLVGSVNLSEDVRSSVSKIFALI